LEGTTKRVRLQLQTIQMVILLVTANCLSPSLTVALFHSTRFEKEQIGLQNCKWKVTIQVCCALCL